jgi:hypothetical protein
VKGTSTSARGNPVNTSTAKAIEASVGTVGISLGYVSLFKGFSTVGLGLRWLFIFLVLPLRVVSVSIVLGMKRIGVT